MKWNQWLTIINDDGKMATVTAPNGDGPFNVRAAALNDEIKNVGDEAAAEFDAWCLANVMTAYYSADLADMGYGDVTREGPLVWLTIAERDALAALSDDPAAARDEIQKAHV